MKNCEKCDKKIVCHTCGEKICVPKENRCTSGGYYVFEFEAYCPTCVEQGKATVVINNRGIHHGEEIPNK